MLFVEGKRCLVVALNVQNHAGHLTLNHALLDGLLEESESHAIASVGLQHCDGHDVAFSTAVVLDIFLARNSTDEHILDVGELAVALHGLEQVVEVLGVDDWESEVGHDSELFKILWREITKFNIEGSNTTLRLLDLTVVKNTLIRLR